MKRVGSVESALESAAAAWFGGCLAYSAWLAAHVVGIDPVPVTLAVLAGGFLAATRTLHLLTRTEYRVPSFDLAGFGAPQYGELLLTDEVLVLTDRAETRRAPVEELVLSLEQRLGVERQSEEADDSLPEIGPDSQVIRLFDPAAMPTAGELQSRIDRHLKNRDDADFPDAAQALNDALADLRRSLR
jgi:hypothetical protein